MWPEEKEIWEDSNAIVNSVTSNKRDLGWENWSRVISWLSFKTKWLY